MGRKKAVVRLETTGSTNIDVFVGHLLQGSELSPKQASRFEVMLKINTLMCGGMSRENVLKYLSGKEAAKISQLNGGEPFTLRHAYRLISEALNVFGDASKVSRDGKRHVTHENFIRLAKKAEKAGDFSAAINALDKAAKIYNLYSTDASVVDAERYLLPVPIYILNDARALTESEEDKENLLLELKSKFENE